MNPAKKKLIGKIVRDTNILEAPTPDLLSKDGKLIDSGQIIIALIITGTQERQMMVSRAHCVTSKDKYITIVSTVAETTVVYLGFEYRSVHDGDRRGFTVKPTAKYVDECLDTVQLQNAKAAMTPLTEQKSLNLHDETTVCHQVQQLFFRAVFKKTAVHYWSETRFDVRDKMPVIQICVTYTRRFDTCQESIEIFAGDCCLVQWRVRTVCSWCTVS